tara:strand:- start:1211 stop:2125 length:915 start_codon:yes stop_codon:yes gene_type:complete
MKILFIGYGSIAQKHKVVLDGIYYQKKPKYYALRSSNESKTYDDIINIYNYNDIPENINFFIISNPTSYHNNAILSLVKYKKPIFIEKPVFHNLDHSEKILSLIKKNNIKTYVACNLRFHKCIKYLKKIIENNYYGDVHEIISYSGSYLPDWRDLNYKECYSSKSDLGGGVHLDLIHEIDYLYWIFGSPNKIKKTLRSSSNLNIDSIDYANYIFVYDNFVININLNYFRKNPKRFVEIVFEKTSIYVDILNHKIYENNILIKGFNKKNIDYTYKDQMKYFLDNINNSKIFNDIKEGVEVLKLAL